MTKNQVWVSIGRLTNSYSWTLFYWIFVQDWQMYSIDKRMIHLPNVTILRRIGWFEQTVTIWDECNDLRRIGWFEPKVTIWAEGNDLRRMRRLPNVTIWAECDDFMRLFASKIGIYANFRWSRVKWRTKFVIRLTKRVLQDQNGLSEEQNLFFIDRAGWFA